MLAQKISATASFGEESSPKRSRHIRVRRRVTRLLVHCSRHHRHPPRRLWGRGTCEVSHGIAKQRVIASRSSRRWACLWGAFIASKDSFFMSISSYRAYFALPMNIFAILLVWWVESRGTNASPCAYSCWGCCAMSSAAGNPPGNSYNSRSRHPWTGIPRHATIS